MKHGTRRQHRRLVAAGVLLALSAKPALADWYFRGTPNNWGTAALTTNGSSFETCQTFSGGDASGGPRFKIDRYGNWTESYPTADYTVANGTYRIQFNPTTHAITTTSVTSCSSADSWYFRGTANAWAATAMTVDSGGRYCTRQSFTTGDAGGGPRFKIDHYANWVESYPATDYSVAANTSYDICFTPSTKAIDVAAVSGGGTGGGVSTGDFRGETIYFLLTARFYDGDPNNNYYNRDRIKIGDPQWRGDFKGLISKLDYIKNLGFTAIWITPPVENRSGLDYHGYHAYDFYKVDPRLESPGATYQDFITAAHAKGLKVIQDVVVNHSGQYGLRDHVWIDHLPIKYYVPTASQQGLVSNNPYFGNLGDYKSANRDDNDNSVAPPWFRDRHNSDPNGTTPLVDPQTGTTVPLAGYNPNRFFGIDATTLDPNWYHQAGFIQGGDWENQIPLQSKHLAGDAIDLATERQNVKDYINGAIHRYLDMGVDAIRLDTVKHVERNNLLEYVNDWKAYKPGLFVFGENLVKGTGWGFELANDNASAVIRPWWYTRLTTNPSNPLGGGDSGLSVLDFSLFSTFRDNLRNGSLGGIKAILDMDWVYGDATKLVTFFQNHDVGPDNDFKYRYGGAESNAALAYNLLWTIRGIPTLYYGEEVMFQAGLPQDISGNSDTLDMTGRAYYGARLDDPATPNHPLYQHIKRLNQIRAAVPALQKAAMSNVNEWGAGMSFVRDYNNGSSYAVVGLATGSTQSVTVNGVRNGTYRDAVTGSVVSVSNGSLSFSVKPYSAGIYVLNGAGKVGADGVYLR